ncbi:MAG TPA: hypothetical protein VF648_00610 [Pyrinomonadaceae bacterium]|jgi:hypothetical protein
METPNLQNDSHVTFHFGRECALMMLRQLIDRVENNEVIFVSGENCCSIIETHVADKEMPLLEPHQLFANFIFDFVSR